MESNELLDADKDDTVMHCVLYCTATIMQQLMSFNIIIATNLHKLHFLKTLTPPSSNKSCPGQIEKLHSSHTHPA